MTRATSVILALFAVGCSLPFNGLSGNPQESLFSNRTKATMMAAGLGPLTFAGVMHSNNVNHHLNDLDWMHDPNMDMSLPMSLGIVTGAVTQYSLWNYEPGSDRTKCAFAGAIAGMGIAWSASAGYLTAIHSRPQTNCGADPTDPNCSYHDEMWKAAGVSLVGAPVGAVLGYFWCN